MFESLSDRLEKAFRIVKGKHRITEINVAETTKEIRRALLDADVNFKIAKNFTDKIKEKALGENVLASIEPGQLLVKITHEELTRLMGEEAQDINLSGNPSVILLSGLQGSGKTTVAAKIANYLKNKKSQNPLLVACDVYRPAAIEQLKVLGEQINVEVYAEEENKDVVAIAKKGIRQGKLNGNTVVIIDTAGRLAIDEQMMDEIARIKDTTKPHETLFVVDAMTGQDAVNTAKAFNEKIDFDGVILTKLDGDTRGGAALSIRTEVDKPIKFVGIGEKVDALDVFYPQRMADRILGMGDIVSFVEKVEEQFDEKEAAILQKKLLKNQYNFNDFLKQLGQIKKMGNVKDLLGMVPGVNKAIKDVEIEDDAFDSVEAIIHSMTPHERENPTVLNGTRRKRIAEGSGTSVQEVNRLLKQFDEMRKMMKMMSKPNAHRAMKNLPFMS
ncbi:signal recognition particle protein [Bacteroidales bacterium AH-315-N07]|nr:signal recognition particle protein [Bacteroidales bacterium AH-315-N07]